MHENGGRRKNEGAEDDGCCQQNELVTSPAPRADKGDAAHKQAEQAESIAQIDAQYGQGAAVSSVHAAEQVLLSQLGQTRPQGTRVELGVR